MTEGYALQMDSGHANLGLGQHVRARGHFTRASELAPDNTAYASALQMRGVVLRLMGKFDSAHQDFKKALCRTPSGSVQAGRIMRDQGLCYLDQARGDDALAEKAYDSLRDSFNILQHQDVVEASTTLSCLGMYYNFVGKHAQALYSLRRGVRLVRGKHIVFEMNNRVRLARASILWRWTGAPRTLIVGVRSKKNVAKLIEFVLLLIGGRRLADAGKRRLADVQLIMTRR